MVYMGIVFKDVIIVSNNSVIILMVFVYMDVFWGMKEKCV